MPRNYKPTGRPRGRPTGATTPARIFYSKRALALLPEAMGTCAGCGEPSWVAFCDACCAPPTRHPGRPVAVLGADGDGEG